MKNAIYNPGTHGSVQEMFTVGMRDPCCKQLPCRSLGASGHSHLLPGRAHKYGDLYSGRLEEAEAIWMWKGMWSTTERQGSKDPVKVKRTPMWVGLIETGEDKEKWMGNQIEPCWSYGNM